MKVALSWLSRYVNMDDVDLDALCEQLPLRGLEIAGMETIGEDIDKVVVGKVVEMRKHPDSDHLWICQVDAGQEETIQIVTGAQNVSVGDLVPAALHGAILPGGVKIKRGKLRGEVSNGMLCSGEELQLKDADYPGSEADGILILQEDYPLGQDIKEALMLSDIVIEAEPTSNRPDLQSVIGIAREVAAAINRPLIIPNVSVKEEAAGAIEDHVKVDVLDEELCPRYMARCVKDIKIEPSPMWMRRALRAVGQRPINNIVDITNFVMHESGQPMHAFDLSCVADEHIIVRRSREAEVITTLDNKTRDLPDDTLLITDNEKAVGIAGVMGGANSEITENSVTVLFESAKFDGTNIRRVSKAMGMMSDAASHFIKGVDIETTEWALERACQLVEALQAGRVEKGVIDVCDPEALERKKVIARPSRINALLSLDLDTEYMSGVLNSLFIPCEIKDEKLELTLPHFRDDIEGEADVAEEVARVYGHWNIKASYMGGTSMRGYLSEKQKWMDKMKDMLCGMGAYEVLTYSFTGPGTYDNLRIKEGNPLRNCVRLDNPFGEDNSWMRSTLITGMLPVISTNSKRTVAGRFFEAGRVHENVMTEENLPREHGRLCLGFYGNDENFYTIKGAVESLMAALDVSGLSFKAAGEEYFHPGRKALIYHEDRVVGEIGEIHAEVAAKYDIVCRTYIAQLDTESLFELRKTDKKYRRLARFPSISRDLALMVPRDLESAKIEEIMRESGSKLLESLALFDIYEGKNLPSGLKSMAYSLVFRSLDRTLTDEEVQKHVSDILDALKKAYDIDLRK